METWFGLSNLLVMPFWLAMLLAPRSNFTRTLMARPYASLVCALLYAALVVPVIPQILPLLMRPRLAEVQALLATPFGATVAWVHFLCFDLLVGRWIYRQARLQGPLQTVVLFFTLMFGPIGYLMHAVLTGARETDRSE